MVSAKQVNAKKRPPQMHNNMRRFKPQVNRNGAAFNNRPNQINPMFTASQIPDNPGYVDFNEPTPPKPPLPNKGHTNVMPAKNRFPRNRAGGNNANGKPHMPRNQNNSNGWGPGRNAPLGQMSNQPPIPPPLPHAQRNFRNFPMPRIGRPMPPPMGMRPPMPPPPAPPNMNPNRFGPRPMMPPPVVGCPVPLPMGPPRPMRAGGMVPPRPIMIPRGNGHPAGGNSGPMRRGKTIPNNRKNMKNRKRPMMPPMIKNKRSTTTKKTLTEILNQYPLDKPWVTDDIRAEQKKKEDIENKLKGNKDDKLFAEFKVQRDKFVKMYETARLEYVGKHPEKDIDKIMTESDKKKGDKQNAK